MTSIIESSLQRLFLLMMLAIFSGTASAGILSTLGKLGKLSKSADNMPSTRLRLPDGIPEDGTAFIRPLSNGDWQVKQPDGQIIVLTESTNLSYLQNPPKVLVVNAFELPADLNAFYNLPSALPVLIRSKTDLVFHLKKPATPGAPWKLTLNSVVLTVKDVTQLKSALWHMQRQVINRKAHLISLASDLHQGLKKGTDLNGHSRESVGLAVLPEAFSKLKRETIVLVAQTEKGLIRAIEDTGQSAELRISELTKAAEQYDINLIFIDSADTQRSLEEISGKLPASDSADPNSTINFYNQLIDPNQGTLNLSIHASGRSQSLVHSTYKSTTAPSPKQSDHSADIHQLQQEEALKFTTGLTIRGITYYHPDEARSEELENRIIPGIPSFVQYYAILSFILGCIALTTSWRFWNAIWKPARPVSISGWLLYALIWPLHKAAFLVLYLPFAGSFSFTWVTVSTLWAVFYVLVISPVLWVRLRYRVSKLQKLSRNAR